MKLSFMATLFIGLSLLLNSCQQTAYLVYDDQEMYEIFGEPLVRTIREMGHTMETPEGTSWKRYQYSFNGRLAGQGKYQVQLFYQMAGSDCPTCVGDWNNGVLNNIEHYSMYSVEAVTLSRFITSMIAANGEFNEAQSEWVWKTPQYLWILRSNEHGHHVTVIGGAPTRVIKANIAEEV